MISMIFSTRTILTSTMMNNKVNFMYIECLKEGVLYRGRKLKVGEIIQTHFTSFSEMIHFEREMFLKGFIRAIEVKEVIKPLKRSALLGG